ncbi:SDR family NAD(P)-dependent oxidoreductase [Nocardia bovistercoris]|uniref:SDR family NAD(P)-dependent oxidoreductase n=1 Tax=Nocardia bovistercoris TaxID=2785916 RepID=A0A931N4C2_9NOCA|nr:SDR family NAD(P)-dependent oxidoreductase [Nocardia bovistercoris]MBH0778567.1 SDR family NAD(P)-dependent oxidoreductase [Nocardia bovistercoris]
MTEPERRVCLLTGAGGALGDAFCRTLYRHYDIVAVHRGRVPAVPSQHEWLVDPFAPRAAIPDNASRVYLIEADLTEPGAVERVVELAIARFGGVDLLVNAAARTPVLPHGVVDGDTALDAFDPTFALNVAVPLRLSTRLAQQCWLHAGGVNRARNRNVVNISALPDAHPAGRTVFAASKAALNQLTKDLAVEFAEFGVRVNGVAPNAFPAEVPTETVIGAILELDRGEMSGSVFSVGARAEAPGRHAS